MAAFYIRLFFFAVCLFLALWGTTDPFQTSYPAGASPLLFLTRTVGGNFVVLSALLPLAILVLSGIKKRFFCRSLCPMGCSFDLIRRGRKRLFKNRALAGVFRLPFVGIVLCVLILTGAVLNLPVLSRPVILDPLVLFCSLFQPPGLLFYITITLFLLAVFVPGFWCGNCCPLGALQDLVHRPVQNIVERIKRNEEATSKEPSADKTSLNKRSRRHFLLTSLACSLTGAVLLAPFTAIRTLVTRRLRPPGALDEPSFSSRCAGCGRCIAACPTKHLIPVSSLYDPTPSVETKKTFCEKECVACGQVCPTGAIRSFTESDKASLSTGLAVYDFDHCVLYMEKECSICLNECPWDAIGLVWSEELGVSIPTVRADRCNGCARCVVMCPGFEPIYQGEETEAQKLPPPPKAFSITFKKQ